MIEPGSCRALALIFSAMLAGDVGEAICGQSRLFGAALDTVIAKTGPPSPHESIR